MQQQNRQNDSLKCNIQLTTPILKPSRFLFFSNTHLQHVIRTFYEIPLQRLQQKTMIFYDFPRFNSKFLIWLWRRLCRSKTDKTIV